jgi:BASS family bile acid:Na+ symporter
LFSSFLWRTFLVPLIGWGTAAVLSLDTPAYVALVLLACSPGAPFAAKLAMIQRGDVVTGASLQVFLAAIGSLTFAPTANAIFTAAKLGGGISLPVGQLVLTVAVLQLLPFAVGLALRKWSPELPVAIDERDAAEHAPAAAADHD